MSLGSSILGQIPLADDSGVTIVTGTIVSTDNDDIVVTSAAVIYDGVMDYLVADDAAVINGKTAFTAQVNATEEDDSITAVGEEIYYGTLNYVLGSGVSYYNTINALTPSMWLRLGENPATGTAFDEMSYQNGTYDGTTSVSSLIASDADRAVQFGGTGSEISVGSTNVDTLLNNVDFSIECHFKVNTTTIPIIARGIVNTGGLEYGIMLKAGTGSIYMQYCIGNSVLSRAIVTPTINAGETYHLVVTRDASTGICEFFINGSSIGSAGTEIGTAAYHGSYDVGFNIGANKRNLSDQYSDGTVDDFIIYDKILIPLEILTNYSATVAEVFEEDDGIVAEGVEIFYGALDVDEGEDQDAFSGEAKQVYQGTLSETGDDDTFIINGLIYEDAEGTIISTDEDDAPTFTAEEIFAGTLSETSDDDTGSATGKTAFTIIVDSTDEDDTVASDGFSRYILTLDVTEEDDIPAFNTEAEYTGTVTSTLDDDSIVANGIETIYGSADASEEDDTPTIVAVAPLIHYIGSLVQTEPEDTTITSGVMTYDFRGTLDYSENDDVPAFNTEAEYTGTTTSSETNDTPTINGGMSIHTFFGTLDIVEDDDTVIAHSKEIFVGTHTLPDEDDFTTTNGIITYSGTLDVTESDDVHTFNGTSISPPISGTLDIVEDDDASVIVSFVPVDGRVIAIARDDFVIASGTVINLPDRGKTANQITRPLVAKTIEKFYVSFYGMTENISNILGSEVMSLERPNLTFNDMDIYNKGKRFGNNATIHYQPLTITFYDDDQSLVNYALLNQVKKQTFKVDDDGFFEIRTKIYSPNGSVPEEFTLKNCHIQNISYSESNVQDATINTISVTITYNDLDYTFPVLEGIA